MICAHAQAVRNEPAEAAHADGEAAHVLDVVLQHDVARRVELAAAAVAAAAVAAAGGLAAGGLAAAAAAAGLAAAGLAAAGLASARAPSYVFPARELPLSGSNRLDLSLPSLGE